MTSQLPSDDPTLTPAWTALSNLALRMEHTTIRELVESDPTRPNWMTVEAPGLHLDTLAISNVVSSKGFVLFVDGMEQELALQQTKFSQPPMFSVEYRSPGSEPLRNPVLAPLARQVAAIITFCNENAPPDEATAKALALVRSALLKVM